MNTQIEQIQRACDIIRANPEERHTLGALAEHVGLSRFHFQRAFTRVVGISPRAFAEACRLGQVTHLQDPNKKWSCRRAARTRAAGLQLLERTDRSSVR